MKQLITSLLLMTAACNQPAQKQKPAVTQMPVMHPKDSITALLKKLPFDAKTDLVCGMPVTAGIEDTLHYKGKLYGFCATGCKEEFLKDPKRYLITKK